MKKIHVATYSPWDDHPEVSWDVSYEDHKLYRIIHKIRSEYDHNFVTVYYPDGNITTYDPLKTPEK